MLFAEKDGAAGIWRIDETPPRRVTDGPAPDGSDVYTIAGDRLIYSDTTDCKGRRQSVPDGGAIVYQSRY